MARELDIVFTIARRVHDGEMRYSGDDYITHPVAVASYTASWGMSPAVIKAALAHDLPDSADIRDYEDALGPTVTAYVRALKVLEGLGRTRDLLLDDLDLGHQFNRNVAVIKVADRLHNALTWNYVPQQKAHRRARETLAMMAPAAAALDLTGIAEELCALSTAVLAKPIRVEQIQPVRGTAAALLAGALRMLPPEQCERYRNEWLADLAQLESRRERAAMATGLLYSAWTIRRQCQSGR